MRCQNSRHRAQIHRAQGRIEIRAALGCCKKRISSAFHDNGSPGERSNDAHKAVFLAADEEGAIVTS